MSVDIAADEETVWQALVSEGGLEPWMGAGATIDPVPGGGLVMPDPVGGRTRSGLVGHVDEQRSLQFTWWPDSRPIERSKVSITLSPIETGTRVTVTEQLLTPPPVGFAIPVASAEPMASAASSSTSFRGFWSWRLAVLSLSSQMVRA